MRFGIKSVNCCCHHLVCTESKRSLCIIHDVQAYLTLIQLALVSPHFRELLLTCCLKLCRDSKLTRILEDSIGGNCKTTMMAMISPALEAYSGMNCLFIHFPVHDLNRVRCSWQPWLMLIAIYTAYT